MYVFGGIYAAGVLGWGMFEIGLFGALGLLGGVAGAWIGGRVDEADRGPESRAGFVLQAIAALGTPFVLAFDELERLANPASVALLDFLLQHAPGNLHLALACRHLPAGLNIAGAVLKGRAAVLTTGQLQFCRTEVAEFFEQRLSGSELDRLVAESAGWPFTLRIARYHYLGYKTLVGAQMRYAVRDRNGWPIAMLGFSTAAWKLAPRDNFIGWTPRLREKNLPPCGRQPEVPHPALDRDPQPRLAHPRHRPPAPASGLGRALQHNARLGTHGERVAAVVESQAAARMPRDGALDVVMQVKISPAYRFERSKNPI